MMQVLEELKKVIDQVCDMVDGLASNVGLPKETGTAVRADFLNYMLYLSASDGQIVWAEANALSEMLGIPANPETMGQFIRQENIYSTKFEQTVPVSFQLMVTLDNVLIGLGKEPEAAKVMLQLYQMIGETMINADGNEDANERVDYKIYINMLQEYWAQNRVGGPAVSGFVKNEGAVAAPKKDGAGVEAPKKG